MAFRYGQRHSLVIRGCIILSLSVAKLVLIGEPARPEMHISNRQDPYFWTNVWAIFKGDFTSGIFDWLPVALIGGGLVGLVVGILVTLRTNRTEGISN